MRQREGWVDNWEGRARVGEEGGGRMTHLPTDPFLGQNLNPHLGIAGLPQQTLRGGGGKKNKSKTIGMEIGAANSAV